jgi:hypothetical protein
MELLHVKVRKPLDWMVKINACYEEESEKNDSLH